MNYFVGEDISDKIDYIKSNGICIGEFDEFPINKVGFRKNIVDGLFEFSIPKEGTLPTIYICNYGIVKRKITSFYKVV